MAHRRLEAVLLLLLLVSGAMTAMAATPTGEVEAGPRVRVEGGVISGTTVDGVHAFKGIPFAAPPVEALRWKPPKPVEPWQGSRTAAEYGPACAQMRAPGVLAFRVSGRYPAYPKRRVPRALS